MLLRVISIPLSPFMKRATSVSIIRRFVLNSSTSTQDLGCEKLKYDKYSSIFDRTTDRVTSTSYFQSGKETRENLYILIRLFNCVFIYTSKRLLVFQTIGKFFFGRNNSIVCMVC